MTFDEKNLLIALREDILEIKNAFLSIPEWISLSDVAESKGLTSQAIRKRLLNGDFEPDIDFKYKGNRIYVARSTISKIKRIRK